MSVGRVLAWALVAALCVAALTAIGAILGGAFDDTDARIIATSLAFAVYSATAASGAALRLRASASLRALGAVTVALSVLSFVLFLPAIGNLGDEGLWRPWGTVTIAAIACSHGSLVAGALRPGDSDTVRAVARASMALAAVDGFFGVLAVSGTMGHVDDRFGKAVAVLVVALLLTSALPPILRRVQRSAQPVAPGVPGRAGELRAAARPTSVAPPHRRTLGLAAEVLATVDRIEGFAADPGNRSSEIRRECARLRELARAHSA